MTCCPDSPRTTSATAETSRSAAPLPRAPGLTHIDTSSHSGTEPAPSSFWRQTTVTRPTGSFPRQAMKLGAFVARSRHSASPKASSRSVVEPNAAGASARAASRTVRRVIHSPGCTWRTRTAVTSPQTLPNATNPAIVARPDQTLPPWPPGGDRSYPEGPQLPGGGAGDRVGAAGAAPDNFETNRDGEHDKEDQLFVPADQAAAEARFGKCQHAQRQPAGTRDNTVSLAAPPEVQHAPCRGGQGRQPIDCEVGPLGQVRREIEQANDGSEVDDGGPSGARQQPVGAALERGVGRQVRGRPAPERAAAPAPARCACRIRHDGRLADPGRQPLTLSRLYLLFDHRRHLPVFSEATVSPRGESQARLAREWGSCVWKSDSPASSAAHASSNSSMRCSRSCSSAMCCSVLARTACSSVASLGPTGSPVS